MGQDRGQVEAVKWFMGAETATLSDAVTLGLRHYQEMLERTVLNEDKNRELARKLYQKHKEVFDFVFSSVPRLSNAIATACMEVIRERDDVVAIAERHFKSRAWMGRPILGDPGNEEAETVYFEIGSGSEAKLILYLGPAPEAFRARLFAAAKSAGSPFAVKSDLTPQWTHLLRHTLVSKSEVAALTADQCGELAVNRLAAFLNENLGPIDAVVLSVSADG